MKMKLINNIKLSLTRADYTEEDYKDAWKRTANKYKAKITYNKKNMTVTFFTGRGWKREPELGDILEIILKDTIYSVYSFEDFASELGCDPDSRKAKKIYKGVQKMAKKVNRVFSKEEQEELITYLDLNMYIR